MTAESAVFFQDIWNLDLFYYCALVLKEPDADCKAPETRCQIGIGSHSRGLKHNREVPTICLIFYFFNSALQESVLLEKVAAIKSTVKFCLYMTFYADIHQDPLVCNQRRNTLFIQ